MYICTYIYVDTLLMLNDRTKARRLANQNNQAHDNSDNNIISSSNNSNCNCIIDSNIDNDNYKYATSA